MIYTISKTDSGSELQIKTTQGVFIKCLVYEALLKNAILMQMLILKNTMIAKTMTRKQQTVHYKAFTNVIKTICRYLKTSILI